MQDSRGAHHPLLSEVLMVLLPSFRYTCVFQIPNSSILHRQDRIHFLSLKVGRDTRQLEVFPSGLSDILFLLQQNPVRGCGFLLKDSQLPLLIRRIYMKIKNLVG